MPCHGKVGAQHAPVCKAMRIDVGGPNLGDEERDVETLVNALGIEVKVPQRSLRIKPLCFRLHVVKCASSFVSACRGTMTLGQKRTSGRRKTLA